MRFQVLPSTIEDGKVSQRQHLVSLIVDDRVAFDAGSIAIATNADQRRLIRDVVLSHAHLDHIAGLPLFIDDQFVLLEEPVRVHGLPEVLEVLQRDVFNWRVYPDFSELSNDIGSVLSYCPFASGTEVKVAHLTVQPIAVNHGVPSCGFIVSDGQASIAMSGDTASTDEFWDRVNRVENLGLVIVECAMPDRLRSLAARSHHLTPTQMAQELERLERNDVKVLVSNIKPNYMEEVTEEIAALGLDGVEILEVGRIYST